VLRSFLNSVGPFNRHLLVRTLRVPGLFRGPQVHQHWTRLLFSEHVLAVGTFHVFWINIGINHCLVPTCVVSVSPRSAIWHCVPGSRDCLNKPCRPLVPVTVRCVTGTTTPRRFPLLWARSLHSAGCTDHSVVRRIPMTHRLPATSRLISSSH
jgi:hypothetical protein